MNYNNNQQELININPNEFKDEDKANDPDWLDERFMTKEFFQDLIGTLNESKSLNEELSYKNVLVRTYNYGDIGKAKEIFKSEEDKNFLAIFVNLIVGDHMSNTVMLYYVQFALLLIANICHFVLILNIPKGSEDEKDPNSRGFPSECTNSERGYFIFAIVWIVIFNLASVSVGSACWAAMRTNEDSFCRIKALDIRDFNGFYVFSYIFSITSVMLFEFKLDCDVLRFLYIPILFCPFLAALVIFKVKLPDGKIMMILNKSRTKVIDTVVINGNMFLNNSAQKQRIRNIIAAMN